MEAAENMGPFVAMGSAARDGRDPREIIIALY